MSSSIENRTNNNVNNSNDKKGVSLYGIGRGILNTGMFMGE